METKGNPSPFGRTRRQLRGVNPHGRHKRSTVDVSAGLRPNETPRSSGTCASYTKHKFSIEDQLQNALPLDSFGGVEKSLVRLRLHLETHEL